jgi:hypothetical protein
MMKMIALMMAIKMMGKTINRMIKIMATRMMKRVIIHLNQAKIRKNQIKMLKFKLHNKYQI